ncbi:hypothetical protein GCG21_08625 [Pseudactinotalea sp. HY160]|uniref:hypothetical protein n=1 Tax=Pseudactinotalea sp. HY160 TaxID=2654490 RepID=UPI00128CFACE|nr:hypothetical protein [Pseudactinotalea sp. HY160]MPV50068.1 hypothetical protein [Pseudactinotalea sp. HY160]
MTGRTVDHGRSEVARPWPQDAHLSGGSRGLVLRRYGDRYRTAFFEASYAGTFLRGEAETIAEAEEAAWAKHTRAAGCPGHEYETRGYTNGAGFCRHCDRFASGVFDVRTVGIPCTECGERTNWTRVAGQMFCREHDPDRHERARLREQARAQGREPYDGPLDELLDELLAAMLDADEEER